MLVIQFLMLGFGILCAKYSPHVLKVPYTLMMPIIIVLCVVGAFSLNNSTYDVLVTLGFGVLGFFMKKFGYPGAPLVLGVILGPMAEQNLNRALLKSGNDWSILIKQPISLAFLILSIISIAVPSFSAARRRKLDSAKGVKA